VEDTSSDHDRRSAISGEPSDHGNLSCDEITRSDRGHTQATGRGVASFTFGFIQPKDGVPASPQGSVPGMRRGWPHMRKPTELCLAQRGGEYLTASHRAALRRILHPESATHSTLTVIRPGYRTLDCSRRQRRGFSLRTSRFLPRGNPAKAKRQCDDPPKLLMDTAQPSASNQAASGGGRALASGFVPAFAPGWSIIYGPSRFAGLTPQTPHRPDNFNS